MSKHWPTVPLVEIARPVSRPISVTPGESYRTIGVKWWGEGAYERGTIDGAQTAATTLSLVRYGDLIINKIWVRHGSTAIASEAVDGCTASGEFPTFELDRSRVLPRWLHWQTKTRAFWDKCDDLSRGTSGKNRIKPSLFLTIPVPLPQLEEQRRIVARIEELAKKIEQARGLKQETYNTSSGLWKTLSRIARETKHSVKQLEEVAEFLDGQRIPLSEAERAGRRGPYPYYGASGIIDYVDDYLFDEDLLLLSEDGANLINRSTPIAFIAKGKYWVNNHAHVLRPMPGAADLRFLAYALSDYDVSVFNFASAQAKLNQANARRISFPMPPVEEQRRIVAYLDDLQARADALKPLQAETSSELNALLPSVLDKAFRREL